MAGQELAKPRTITTKTSWLATVWSTLAPISPLSNMWKAHSPKRHFLKDRSSAVKWPYFLVWVFISGHPIGCFCRCLFFMLFWVSSFWHLAPPKSRWTLEHMITQNWSHNLSQLFGAGISRLKLYSASKLLYNNYKCEGLYISVALAYYPPNVGVDNRTLKPHEAVAEAA